MALCSPHWESKASPWNNFWRTIQPWKKKNLGQAHRLLVCLWYPKRLEKPENLNKTLMPDANCSPLDSSLPSPPRKGQGTHQSLGCSNWDKRDWESLGSSNPLWLLCSQSLWNQARTPGPHHWCSLSENHPAETPGASGGRRLAVPGWVQGPAGGPWASLPCCQEPAWAGWHSRPLAKTEDGESEAILSSRGWTLTAGLPEPSSLSEFKGTAPPFKNIYSHPLLESQETNSFGEAGFPNNPELTPGESATLLFWVNVPEIQAPTERGNFRLWQKSMLTLQLGSPKGGD